MPKSNVTKQMIHIGSEICALLGIVLYFNSQNKTLRQDLKQLHSIIENQAEKIEKHEQSLVSLTKIIHAIQYDSSSQYTDLKQNYKKSYNAIPKRNTIPTPTPKKVSFDTVEEEFVEDSDLDEEIAIELQELEEEVAIELQEKVCGQEYVADITNKCQLSDKIDNIVPDIVNITPNVVSIEPTVEDVLEDTDDYV